MGQRRAQRTDHIQDADNEQHLLAAVLVGGFACGESTHDGADQGRGYHEAKHERGETKFGLNRVGGAGNDGCVKTEDEATDGGDNSAPNN